MSNEKSPSYTGSNPAPNEQHTRDLIAAALLIDVPSMGTAIRNTSLSVSGLDEWWRTYRSGQQAIGGIHIEPT